MLPNHSPNDTRPKHSSHSPSSSPPTYPPSPPMSTTQNNMLEAEKSHLSLPSNSSSLTAALSLPRQGIHDEREKALPNHEKATVPDARTTNSAADQENQAGKLEEMVDGGLHGWMTVCGSWLIMFSTLGYIYSFGVYEDYYTRVLLKNYSPSAISWMGSFQLALPFALGPIAGRIFDAGYVRILMMIGSLIFLFSLFMLSLVRDSQYYQIFLSQGVGMGIGTGFLFTPSTSVVGVRFQKNRSLAYGITLTGISIGAVVFPILLNHLLPRIGFADSVRITGYITLGCLIAGVSLIRPPPRPPQSKRSTNIASFFRDPPYLCILLSTVVALLGIYFPAVFIQLYAVKHNIGDTLAFYSVAILNGASIIGRLGATWLADRYGIWNVQVPTTLGTAATIWAVLGTHDQASLVVVSCLYGILSGAWLAITISGLVSLSSSPHEVGARVGVANAFMSIGILVSSPVQGALLTSHFYWVRPIVYSATLMTASTVFSIMIRIFVAKRKGSQRV